MKKDDRKKVESFKNKIENTENGICHIPLNLCTDIIKLIEQQENDYENLYSQWLHEGRY